MEDGNQYLTGAEAMQLLGVRAQTLYAYVSRGFLQSVRVEGKRDHLYSMRDINKLKARAQARAGHAVAAAAAMHGDQSIIPTRLVQITPEGPTYRGHLSIDLASRGASFEGVTELLWSGALQDEPVRWTKENLPDATKHLIDIMSPFTFEKLPEVFSIVALSLRMQRGPVRGRLNYGSPLGAARQMIQAFMGCFGLASRLQTFVELGKGESTAECIARCICDKPTSKDLELIDSLLVLMAEHELAPGTFAARVAASSGAAIQPCVVAAISVQTGTRVGCVQDLVEESLTGAHTAGKLSQEAKEFINRGQVPPGFSNSFYPAGDPRCHYLLSLLRERSPDSQVVREVLEYIDCVWDLIKLHPRHEIAIAAIGLYYGLPKGFGSAIFTLARCAGWVAHILEQRQDGAVFRPRAKYIG
jgi:citrate synthase